MAVGYYGKLPDRGDFVSRGIPLELEQAVHHLGSFLIAHGRDQHGDGFADIFADMPLYAMIAGPGGLIDRTIAGLFGPSADGVGRLFPFFVLTDSPLTGDVIDAAAYTAAADIVDRAAFERTPLDKVEEELGEINLTAPDDCKGLWLAGWSVSGPTKRIHEFADLADTSTQGLDRLLMGGGTE
ncbi:MAG: type VI secretion system-associated protein TagF [Pseudomonadota bacterium]